MIENPVHIEKSILTGRQSSSFTPMYSMHKYWSRKPSEVIANYIKRYTKEDDIVLDPFSGSGVTIFEALKIGRKAIGIDLNPVANFITRVTLEPVNLNHLHWAFRDAEQFYEKLASELFETRCPHCGNHGSIDFVARDGDDIIEIGYSCTCSHKRLFKQPDENDRQKDESSTRMDVPFWYPCNVPLPTTQKEAFSYVHELFTRRNIIALSAILHAINNIQDERIRNVMKLAFSGALDKCSRLKPLAKSKTGHYSLSEGWIAPRFYTPLKWQEVNPFKAFKRSYLRVYEGKKESNKTLPNVSIGSNIEELKSGKANVVLFQGSANDILANKIKDQSIDYILTDPPFGSTIQYMTLSTFWGAWLGLEFDYDREIIIDTRRGKTREQYDNNMHTLFQKLGRVAKKGGYAHIFYSDVKEPYLHMILKSMIKNSIVPQRIIHQTPPNSFSVNARARKGYYGSYIIRGKVMKTHITPTMPLFEAELRNKITDAARQTLLFQNGNTTIGSVLHSIYEQLDEHEISIYAQHHAERFVEESVGEFAKKISGARLKWIGNENIHNAREQVLNRLRTEVLNAKSILADEGNNITRVRQLAERRLGIYGIPLEILHDMSKDIKGPEIKNNRQIYFADLFYKFGQALGFQSSYSTPSQNSIVWTKENNLSCGFELTDKHIRVLTSYPESGNKPNSMWGTVSYFSFLMKLKKWCMDNDVKGKEISKSLEGLEGPSYNPPNINNNSLDDYSSLKLRVLDNIMVCPEHYLLRLGTPKEVKLDITPGQFFHITCDPDEGKEQGYPLTLRRPFSIHGAHYPNFKRKLLARSGELPMEIRGITKRERSAIDILYKVVGKGTKNLSQHVKPGDFLNAIGPCGNGFVFDAESNQAAVIVAGGIGIAPLVALAEQLRYLGKQVFVYFGTLNKELLSLGHTRSDSAIDYSYTNGTEEFKDIVRDDFQEIGASAVNICTDKGDIGERKLVTDLLEKDLQLGQIPLSNVCIYACGPTNMLRSVAQIAGRYSIPCQVLMEQRMACGIGACLSCTCDTIGPDGAVGKKRVCVDGPVFDAGEIKWRD